MNTFWRVSRSQAGFSMIELLVSTGIMLIISAVVTAGILQMTTAQQTIWNRTEMHGGVRSATELLQQEVGQAGRVTLPGPTILTGAAAIGASTVGVSETVAGVAAASVAGMFVGENLLIDAGANEETVALTAVNTATNQITATFTIAHAANAPVQVFGGFAAGIVPPTAVNGSTATVMKLFGDINADGNMVYIEYTCDTVGHTLSRNSMAYNAVAKPALTAANTLLSNIYANPNATPCFTYQTQVVAPNTYVVDVAITLTVQTQDKDSVTQAYQTETKALLNVAPRNVFNTWELASAGGAGAAPRVQPTPPSVTTLMGL